MIRSIRHKGLRRLWVRNDSSGIAPEWLPKVKRQLFALEAAHRPAELDRPGFGFHALKGDLGGRFALTVSRNWRLTFGWDGQDAVDIDLEDYHGR